MILDSIRGWRIAQHCQHVSRFDMPFPDLFFVALVQFVDKGSVSIAVCIEVMTEAPIDKRGDDIGKTNKEMKVKILLKKWQDVLGTDSFTRFK